MCHNYLFFTRNTPSTPFSNTVGGNGGGNELTRILATLSRISATCSSNTAARCKLSLARFARSDS
jgi:hypothetical protein